MDYIKDALEVNKSALTRTIKSLKYFPAIVLAIVVMVVGNMVGLVISAYLSQVVPSIVSGIILYIIDVITMSILMSCLYSVIVGSRLNVKNFTQGWQRYISPLMATRFIFWIIEMVIGMVPVFGPISYILSIALSVLMSPMLETVYIDGESGVNALMSIINFLKDNVVQWIPVAVVIGFLFTILNSYIGLGILFLYDIKLLLTMVASMFALAFVYIYKGHLYDILHDSSMRKRKFQGVFDR